MLLKSIIQGKLEFGKQATYDTALKMLQSRLDTFYKNEIIFRLEDVMDEENFSINVGRNIENPELKYWNNSIGLLKYARQYAIAGCVSAWLIENRQIREMHTIEPRSEKVVVQSFLKGRKLIDQKGKVEEGIAMLTKSISMFDRHAIAYAERGRGYLSLGKEKEALKDFDKSISLDDQLTLAFLHRGSINVHNEKWGKAVADLEKAVKNSVARQNIHWNARRLAAKSHIVLGQLDKAAFHLKLWALKVFDDKNELLEYQHKAMYDYVDVLYQQKEYKEAQKYIEKAINYEAPKGHEIGADQLLLLKGNIQHALGAKGFAADWKKAAALGSKEAKKLLQQHA